jgi:hypothetical protein
MLTKELAVVGNSDGTPGGLALDRGEYTAFIRNARTQAADTSVTPVEVAKMLGCDPGTVPEMVRLGLLSGCFRPIGLRVTMRSIQEFQEMYVSLAALARTGRTSSRALMRRCNLAGIPLLLIATTRKGGPQPFASLNSMKEAGLLDQLEGSSTNQTEVGR